MSREDKIKEIKNEIDEYNLRSLKLARFTSREEARFDGYMKDVCQRLLGDTLDLDKERIIFVLSDKMGVNAAYCPMGNKQVIYITEELLNMCDNEDQLAFVMGHELGHFEEKLRQGMHQNSKAEEAAADVRAVHKMARGGYNLEEAYNMAVKLFNERHIDVESLRDPHTNNSSRVNAVSATIIKEKERIIEEQGLEVTQSTPIPDAIMKMVHERPKQQPLVARVFDRIQDVSDKGGSVEEQVNAWFQAFNEQICQTPNGMGIPEDDRDALKDCISRACADNEKFADAFLAETFARMEKARGTRQERYLPHLMHDVLDKIYTWDTTYEYRSVHADEPDSKTAVWLRHYLHGFREASGEKFDEIIANLEHVKKFVARSDGNSYRGILVKDFNLLELEFSENDVGKKVSPQIIKWMHSNINAYNKFVTFSGLTAHKMSDHLVLTSEKKDWSVFIDAKSGEIAYSFPAQDLEKMQTQLMGKIVESAWLNVQAINDGKITDPHRKLEVLREAYAIITPPINKNYLRQILDSEKKADDTPVLYEDVAAVLPAGAKEFFSERVKNADEEKPYTGQVTDLYAEAIRTAPKESYQAVFEALITTSDHGRNQTAGKDKLMRAFLDNPAFVEELQKTIKSYEPFPEKSQGWDFMSVLDMPDSSQRFDMLNFVTQVEQISDLMLKEHLEKGGTFNDFEPPFKKDLAKLFDFAPEGSISEEEMLRNIKKTRQNDRKSATLYEQAYVAFAQYDALKDDTTQHIDFLLEGNSAGIHIKEAENMIGYFLKEREKYHIDEAEAEQLHKQAEALTNASDKVHRRLVERIENNDNTDALRAMDVFYAVLDNNRVAEGIYGDGGVNSLVTNADFTDVILQHYENKRDVHSCVLALNHIVNESEKTSENDAAKEKIWPSIAKSFERDDFSIRDKVGLFQTLTEYGIFGSDYKRYYEVLIGKDGKGGLLAELEKEDVPESDKLRCYIRLLSKDARIPDPEIRADVVKKTALYMWKELGEYNDIKAGPIARQAVIGEILRLDNSNIADLDKIELLKEFSELTMSQKELSLAMKPAGWDMQTSDKRAIISGLGIDVLAYAMQEYPETKEHMQDFLLGEGKAEEAAELVREIQIAMCKEHDKYRTPKVLERYLNGEDISGDLMYNAKNYYNKLNTQTCLHFKKEFDAASLEIKAVIVNEILTNGKNNWEDSFKVVSAKLFDGAGELGKVGSDFLHSYIAARPNSEKTFYLAAMMAAANNKSKSSDKYVDSPYTPEERNMAKGLRLFLENSGPAGTKLAQAMASYNEVPEFIRHEMQFAKSEANPPARWEVFSGKYMDKLLKHGPLGKRLGSASFFVTYELGDKVVKIMRRGAQLKADNEFAIYKEMLKTLSSEYKNISSFKRLVQNAADNVRIETNLKIGEKQYKDAKKLYPESVKTDGIDFKIEVMDWVARDKEYAVMERAQGVDFKDLQDPYKTAAAKAVFATELSNMLSGKRFDSDRHGGQYKFDTRNNVIGVFDTGSMSVIEPTEKEREVLGIVLARTLKGLRHNPNVTAVFSAEIDRTANEFYADELAHNRAVPPYLSEFQRGMLALNDFYAPLSGKDMAECVIKALDNGHNQIHPQIVKAFKLEIKKSLDNRQVTIQSLINPENADKLAPEARANRRIGKILFDAVFKSMSEGKGIDMTSDAAQKLISKLNHEDSDLQIVKGVVRGAYAKLNPRTYSPDDRKELGAFLYEVCRADLNNQKIKKEEALENIVAQTALKYPHLGAYTKNVMSMVALMSKIPALSGSQLKKAATFVAFADKDVSHGFKKALKEDKSVGFAKRMMLQLAPMDFIPHNSKKMLIKAVSKRFLLDYVGKKIFGAQLEPKAKVGEKIHTF